MFQKRSRGSQNAHFMFYTFFILEIRAVYAIMWKSTAEQGRPRMKCALHAG
jgi:hypothetical protein